MPGPKSMGIVQPENVVDIKEQALLLLESSGTAAIVNFFISLLTYFSIPSKSHTWFWLLIASSALRFSLYIWHKKNTYILDNCLVVFRVILFLVILQGLSWGFASFYLYSVSIDLHKFYLIAITCGMAGGSILTLAPSLAAFSCFTLPCTLPLVLVLLLDPEKTLNYSGIMGIIFIVAIHLFARRISLSHREIRKSRRQLKKYSEELSDHKEQLEVLVEDRTNELKKSRENYRQLIEEINDVIFELDSLGIITYVSPVVTAILGHQPHDLIGKKFTQLVYPDDLDIVLEAYNNVISGILKPLDYRIFDSDNNPHWVRSSSRPVMNGENLIGVRGVLSDIEQEKKSEKEKEAFVRKVGEHQKLEAIGTLAAGIAHDFNNLLMGISGRVSLMLATAKLSGKNIEHLEALENYVQSAKNLTSQLLGAARGGKYNPKPVDLSILVNNSLSMFGRTKKEIETSCNTPDFPVVVEADEKQIEQVLLNMYVNAWQAMPNGGKLQLTVAPVTLEGIACEPYLAKPGQYAKISITDSGNGMDEETQQKVFDPFFTTKEKERGTGLGLASAYGIIRNHGGFISVYSEIGKGSVFTIFLPLSNKETDTIPESKDRIIHGSGKVLLVDDEDLIIEVGQALLQALGYEVIVAKGGREAITRIINNKDKIDLVILDMIMPQMDGSKTFDKIRELSPDLPVILSSGYSIDGLAAAILKRGCNDFIQKPFNMAELSAKISRILDVH